MYKALIIIITLFLVIHCGGSKKETPVKPASDFKAVIKTVEPTSVAAIENTGPYTEFGKAMGELYYCIMQRQIKPIGAPMGIYYNSPAETKPESLKYDVCIPVSPDSKGDKLVAVKTLAGGEVASTVHVGAYDKLSQTYEKFGKWIVEQGYMISGPAREIYLNDPSVVANDSLKTEIQFPVMKK